MSITVPDVVTVADVDSDCRGRQALRVKAAWLASLMLARPIFLQGAE
jgi:hypothetical protein